MTRTFDDVLGDLRSMSRSTREQGDYFERLIKRALEISPVYADQFDKIWLFKDWPGRGNRKDTGIDLVAQEAGTGDLVGIQCKFWEEDHYLSKAGIDSFVATVSGKDFSRGILISTTGSASKEVDLVTNNSKTDIQKLFIGDLRDFGIDWSTFKVLTPEDMQTTGKKRLRKHQREAVDDVINNFAYEDRGQLIMACGTGKTYTSLKLVEEFVPHGGKVLFLVPSISLLQQTLIEWKIEAERPMHCYAVCSDTSVGTKKNEDTNEIHPHDLVIPATTDAHKLARGMEGNPADDLTIVFSTYQSISQVIAAQNKSDALGEFDLIICDEAHRTTGVAASANEVSEFMKVHNNDLLKANKRLYMTATPRIYDDKAQQKAEDEGFLVASMNDKDTYGPEFHRLGFGKAVENDLLADYKVQILVVSEDMLTSAIDLDSTANGELNLDDAVKIVGTWNGLAKRDNPDTEEHEFADDPAPMRRAVAFSRSIKDSKHIKTFFPQVVDEFIDYIDEKEDHTRVEIKHVDGTHSVLSRAEALNWLKQGAPEDDNTCRILTNARCLSEGVDVPALDAVLFLNPRDSVVDVVQSVGRVMRKAEGKKYGYIILPIAIPSGMSAEEALNDSTAYKTVWQVLQALRAHDDRFEAIINKLDLNKKKDGKINVIGVGGGKKDPKETDTGKDDDKEVQIPLDPSVLNQWKNAIYAKIVARVGQRDYWDHWAKDIASIADRHITRMRTLVADKDAPYVSAFQDFLTRLQEEINPAVDQDQAIEMLAQHLITRPVFEALFDDESFALNNPVSQAMQQMLDAMNENTLEEERTTLDKFYDSVRMRARGVDNAEGRQKIVIRLYEEFFKGAFPMMAERLGIVYTPIEVVDYLLHSADYVLRQHFGKGLTDEGVHILDPFTGTGTFITRLLQSGLIRPEDAERKFTKELHANEIVLLAYYIAAVNIEMVFQEAFGGEYKPFEGIVWTDTFQMTENEQVSDTDDGAQFKIMEFNDTENSKRAIRQMRSPIKVIVGNPPYSAGQGSANDDNQNLSYPMLDHRIETTYAAASSATLKRHLYDSYIRAFRWASDRIDDQGVVAYVSNASFLESNAMDGLRKYLADEFSSVWLFNARGNQRTSGELSRKEGGKLFGSGSRTPVALTLLVKDPAHTGPCQIHYHDIGDYLDQKRKLEIIRDFASVHSVPWQSINPNENFDWINLRDPSFQSFIPITQEKPDELSIFSHKSLGISTNRDSWVYGFSEKRVSQSTQNLVTEFNRHIEENIPEGEINYDPAAIKWTDTLRKRYEKGEVLTFDFADIRHAMYRPFVKQHLYYARNLIHRVYQTPRIFPDHDTQNLAIDVTGTGVSKSFSVLMTNVVPDLQNMPNGQAFPLYVYEPSKGTGNSSETTLFGDLPQLKSNGISSSTESCFQHEYRDAQIRHEDIFYYVYGVLHSPEYRTRFEADLKKMLPRIPFTQDFWVFSNAGRELGDLHVGYEQVEPWQDIIETQTKMPIGPTGEAIDDKTIYRVQKMKWEGSRREPNKSVLVYNEYFTLSNIPLDAQDYIVNGKSALDWIVERYAYDQDKDSKIINDPNEWSDDPRYIIDLVKRIVTVSMETNRIVASLPPLNERDVKW